MPGRKFSAGVGYRYGFNGKENENDVKGEGGQQDYGMRIYDPRLGKFLSVDPITAEYPELTPYQFASNRPIDGIDLDGLEHYSYGGVTVVHDNIPRVSSTGVVNLNTRKPATAVKPAQLKAAEIKSNRTAPAIKELSTFSADRRTPYQRQQSAQIQATYNKAKALAGATMDPLAAGVAFQSLTTTKEAVQSPFRHGYGIYEGFKEGDGWKVAGNAFGLALDISPFLLRNSGGINSDIPSRLARIIPEEFAGSPTLGAPGAIDVFVVDAAHIQGMNSSMQIAKRLTLLDNKGNLVKGPFRVIEFDTPHAGLAQPFNRTNPGFVNGGKTAGGASEYILPNLEVKSLKNVSQRTIQ